MGGITTLVAEVSLRQVLALSNTRETNAPQALKPLPTSSWLQGPPGPHLRLGCLRSVPWPPLRSSHLQALLLEALRDVV